MYPLISDATVEDICDFGCGDGYYLHHFGRLYPNKRYYGVDISPTMLERARHNAPFAQFRLSRSGIDFEHTFDLVYAVTVFAHIHDDLLQSLMRSIYGHLRPGGRFILFEQTGVYRMQGTTWCQRTTQEYVTEAISIGFSVNQRILISFPAHRFFEKYVAPAIRKALAPGRPHHERCIRANRSIFFRTISKAFLGMTKTPMKEDKGAQDGYTFYVFEK
jgi:SAM-dependent methyltransferase